MSSTRFSLPLSLVLSCTSVLPVCDLAAQCGPTQTPLGAVPGATKALVSMADGRIAVGGWFASAPAGLSRVGIYDPVGQTWETLGGGVNGNV